MPTRPKRYKSPTRLPKPKRKSTYHRGYDKRWERESKAFLSQPRNRLCRECIKIKTIKLATVVDHIVPHRGNPELFWNVGNWQGLCVTCHNKKTRSGR